MFGHAAKSGAYHYYVCSTVHRNGKQFCDTRPVPRSLIENQVVQKVRELILQEGHLKELVRLTNEELQESLTDVESRLNSMDKRITDVEGRLGRLYDALETGKLDLDDLAPRIKELKDQRKLLLRARREVEETLVDGRVELVSREVVLSYLKDLNVVLDGGTVSERRAFLSSFIESIETQDTKVAVRYTLPLPPEDVELDPTAVLDLVSLGGAEGTRTASPDHTRKVIGLRPCVQRRPLSNGRAHRTYLQRTDRTFRVF